MKKILMNTLLSGLLILGVTAAHAGETQDRPLVALKARQLQAVSEMRLQEILSYLVTTGQGVQGIQEIECRAGLPVGLVERSTGMSQADTYQDYKLAFAKLGSTQQEKLVEALYDVKFKNKNCL